MSITASRSVVVVDASLIEPPLGSVQVEVSSEIVQMRFPDGDVEVLPRGAVRALDRRDFQVTVHWAGTPVVLSFDTLGGSARIFSELGGLEVAERTFTFLLSASTGRHTGIVSEDTRDEPVATTTGTVRYGALTLLGLLAAFGVYATALSVPG